MSLQAILNAIIADGDAQVREIEERASVQAHEIQAENILEAQLVKEQAFMEASAPSVRKHAQLIHLAHLEAMQRIGGTRDALVENAFEKIRECLSHYRADPNYPTVLSRLVQEALSELEGSSGDNRTLDQERTTLERQSPGSDILLLADKRDEGILENILTTMKLELPVQYASELPIHYELECWGGIIARSMDGRIVSINTLEARLERATPYLRRYLAACFENEQPETELAQADERPSVRI